MGAGCCLDGYFDVAHIGGRSYDEYQSRCRVEFFRDSARQQITDIIAAFEAENPGNTVTVVDNGATATLEANIIAGNTRGVDLFLAADTETPQDLLVNHFELVTPL
jgi:ABC-type glycerol-3-phosphate transport system substrate-binding protein